MNKEYFENRVNFVQGQLKAQMQKVDELTEQLNIARNCVYQLHGHVNEALAMQQEFLNQDKPNESGENTNGE